MCRDRRSDGTTGHAAAAALQYNAVGNGSGGADCSIEEVLIRCPGWIARETLGAAAANRTRAARCITISANTGIIGIGGLVELQTAVRTNSSQSTSCSDDHLIAGTAQTLRRAEVSRLSNVIPKPPVEQKPVPAPAAEHPQRCPMQQLADLSLYLDAHIHCWARCVGKTGDGACLVTVVMQQSRV